MVVNITTILDKINLSNIPILDKINFGDVNIYFKALLIFAISISILRIFKFVIIKKLKNIAEKVDTKYVDIAIDMIDKIGWHFYILFSLYMSFHYLAALQFGIFSEVETILYYIIVIIAIYHAVKTIHAMVDHSADILTKRKDIDTTTIDVFSRITKSALWIIAIIAILSNLGYNVAALVAGLGIGGIAIAFALQNILGDVFASFSIFLDKPFKKGDYVIFGTEEGIVKQIGMKSTRVEALQGQEIIVPNKTLTDTTVHNYKKMDYRRIVFHFSIKYETTTVNLERIPNIIKDVVTNVKMVRFGRAHFYKFGDFGYVFEIVYFIDSSDYSKYMDVQQEINFAIKKYFEIEGIEIAYPTYWQKPAENGKL